jgi:type I restriction enzyme, S subunit
MFNLIVPTRWKLTKLSKLGEVNRGRSRHRPRDAQHLYGGPYPFVQTGDVKASGGRINRYTQTYSEDGLAQSRLWPKGTMCITIAANIAETGILEFPACFPDSVIGFIPDKNKCNVYFIEYVFRFLRKQIQAQATGSVQDNINLQTLELLEFPIPDVDEQNRIADILCSFDNQIHLNTQTNQTLESIAQAIFKSWFVDFDPVKAKIAAKERWYTMQPTSESASPVCYADEAALPDLETYTNLAAMCAISGKNETELVQLQQQNPDHYQQLAETAALFPSAMVDSELGEIPEGWQVKTLSDLVNIIGGGTPSRSIAEYWNGDIPWFSIKDLPNPSDIFVIDTEEGITELGFKKSSTKLLPENTTIITARGTVGKLAMIDKPMCMNQSCYGITGADGIGPIFNYFNLREAISTLQRNTHGAVFDTITTKTFESYSSAFCGESLTEKFNQTAKPLLDKIKCNLYQIKYLSDLRDSLLPKLLSGEIDLTEIQSEVA